MIKLAFTDTTPPELVVEYGAPDFEYVDKHSQVRYRVHRFAYEDAPEHFRLASMLRLISATRDQDGNWVVLE